MKKDSPETCAYCNSYKFKIPAPDIYHYPAFCNFHNKHFKKSRNPPGKRTCTNWEEKVYENKTDTVTES